MDVSVMTEAELAPLISTPDNEVFSAGIFKLHHATVLYGEHLFGLDWDILLARQH